MPILNVTHSLNLSGSGNIYLNHPANAGMSEGYWYYYSSSISNSTLGAKIKPHRWGSALKTNETGDVLTIQGTIVLVSESLRRQQIFHGGGTIRGGAGTNRQTGLVEDDNFYFYHLGDLNAVDNVGYWDLALLPQNSTTWSYFPYHQHIPNVYEDFNNGRQIHSSQYFINTTDKRFAHIQPTNISSMGADYTNVMLRVHQPSVGGAHNSHTDVELGATSTKNYYLGGVVAGTSNRFHAFYLSPNGNQTDIFTRTFLLSSNAVTSEIALGSFNLATASFTQTAGSGRMEAFPFRASAGLLYGTNCYVPVIYSGSGNTFDLKIWKFPSADSVLLSTITTQSLATGLNQRPDCHLVKTQTKLTALVSDINNGGVDFYILTGSDESNWVNEGNVFTNGTEEIIRIHGAGFNTSDSKFYVLVSGNITGSGTRNYSGSGVYSFSDGATFSGYSHLSFLTGSNGTGSFAFQIKNANEIGYIKYTNNDGSFTFISSSAEPQSIAETERILIYDDASPEWYARFDTKIGGSEFYYSGLKLKDGRLVGVGNVEDNLFNLGGYDLLMAIYSDDAQVRHFLGSGGDRDEYFTGLVEDDNKNIWLSGYTKSYLAQIRDIKIHAFGRGLLSGSNKYEWKDFCLDSNGNQYYVGNNLNQSSSLLAKYDYNLDLSWLKNIESTGSNTIEEAEGITIDSSDNIYIAGKTNSVGNGGYDAYVAKFSSDGDLVWNKYFGTLGNEYASSIKSIRKGTDDLIVTSIISGSDTIVVVLDTSGSIKEQNKIQNFIANKVRKVETEAESLGYFLLAGKTTNSPVSASIVKCQASASNMVRWVRYIHSSSVNLEAFDIRDTEQANTPAGLGSQTGPQYVVVGNVGKDGFVTKLIVDEDDEQFQSTKLWSTSITASSFTGLTNTEYNTNPEGGKKIYIVGYSSSSLEGEGGWEGIIASFSSSGVREWTNTLGHTSDEKLFNIERDVTGENIISAGWSESHTNGRRTFQFRSSIGGLGTGNYHEKDSVGMQMWYQSSSLLVKSHNNSITPTNATITGSNVVSNLTTLSGSLSGSSLVLTHEFYDGGNLWDLFIAKFNLDDWAEYQNSNTHKFYQENFMGNVEYVNNLFKFYQVGTAGDGAADDGNTFGYDIIKMSGSNNLFVAGQTSGNIIKNNIGASGVYDYLNVIFNTDTEEFEFYQNGTEFDEEVYNATLINDGSGSVAFVGRTAGTLGGPIVSGYDLFLGIYNPISEVTTYFSTGSGQNDRGLNVHDLGNNELAVVFETAATITPEQTSKGGFDIGVIKFNYSSSKWATSSYQTGTTEDEILTQDGKPSIYLKESNRIAIVGKTLGTFADDGNVYGYDDMFLGVLDLTSGTWKRYQIGTAANETGTVVFSLGGDRLVVGGFSDASFAEPNNGVFAVFDASRGIKGKSV